MIYIIHVLHCGLPRRLGQHFLVRDSILERLALATCGEYTPRVIEIGPGRGALTRHLLPHTDELHAVELDRQLVEHLARNFSGEPKLHLHQADVLDTDLRLWSPAVVCGNLPYYITSPIVVRFLSLGPGFHRAVFLMQAEVAERLLAGPGTRDYGYLTVATQLLCDVELVCRVPAAAFAPPPKVESAAVRLTRKPGATVTPPDLLRLISLSFRQKRKTLRNNLRAVYGARIDALPEAALRAEQLSVAQFIDLHARLSADEQNFVGSVN